MLVTCNIVLSSSADGTFLHPVFVGSLFHRVSLFVLLGYRDDQTTDEFHQSSLCKGHEGQEAGQPIGHENHAKTLINEKNK